MSLVGMRKFMQGRMQYIMLALAVVMALAIVGMMTGTGGRSRAIGDDTGGVLAKVNGEKIERQDFEHRYMKETEQTQDTRVPSAFEEAQMRGRLFDQMVDQMLRVQAAEKAGIKVRRGEIKKKINEYIDMRIAQIREQVLANRKGKKTDEALDAELRKSGASLAQIKAEIRKAIDPAMVREQLLIQKHLDKVTEGIDTSDRALGESFDEIRLAQITVSAKGISTAQAEQKAKDILAKLRRGEDFAKLAMASSDDSLSASGGEQSMFTRKSSMSPQLADAAFRLKVGDLGGPIRQADGYVIIKVKERRSALPADFNDPKKKKEYRDAYKQQEQYRLQGTFESEMKQKANIVVNDPEIKGYLILKDVGSYLGPEGGGRAKEKAKEAIQELQKAASQSTGDSQALARCYSQIAYLYYVMGKTVLLSPTPEEKIEFRTKAIEAVNESLKYTESNDLRTMLADLYVESKDYDRALAELKYISDNEFYDYNTHMQILSKYQELKSFRPQVVAQGIAGERKWIADYEQRMREAKAQQPEQAQQSTKPFRVVPKPGG